MRETALAKKSAGVPAAYADLRRRVHETLLLGQRAVEEARVRTYWETGWWIKEHLLLNRHRAGYGDEVLRKLSRDEGVSGTVFKRCRQFAEKFPGLFPKPIGAARHLFALTPYLASKRELKSVLTWTHYRTLLPLEDEKLRVRLAREAARRDWTVPELEAQIQSRRKSPVASSDSPPTPVLLTPKKGELFTYRIVEDGGALALDQGFAKYWNLSREEAGRFRKGDIVRKVPGGKMEKLQKPTPAFLYTYEADVVRVTDADTLWMKIYLEGRGSPPWVKEKLRLRDIDAPELKTPEGNAAKRFVEGLVESAARVLITTTKPDKWDRYLSDVFLIRADGPEIYLNNHLLQNGHARVKTQWSLYDWEA